MGKAEDRRKEKARAVANADERRRVVLRVYEDVDAAGARELARLAGRGVTASCREGCAYCCHLEIPITRPEGEALAAWLLEHRTPEEVEAIRERLRGWLAWYRGECRERVAGGMSRVDVFFRHAPPCALLEGSRCGAYPARPISCRNHYVSSPVEVCDPERGDGDSAYMTSVGQATQQHVAEIRRVIEQQGGSFLASVHLLPEWLAHLLGVEREPWQGSPPLELGVDPNR